MISHAWLAAPLFTLCCLMAGAQAPKPDRDAAVVDRQDFAGRIEAAARVEVRARVTGHLLKILFQDGEAVKRGDVLFEIDPRLYQAELERAQAEAQRTEARLRRLSAELDRVKGLRKQGAASQDELDRVARERDEAAAAIQVARAGLEIARLHLSFTRVEAPMNGRVGRRLLDPGNLVRADETALVTITAADPAYVVFEVDERTALRLRRGQAGAPLMVAVGLADEEGFPHAGKVDFTDTQVNPKTGTLTLRAVLPNKDRLLVPGQFARVRVSLPRTGKPASDKPAGGKPAGRTSADAKVQWLLQERVATLKEIAAKREKAHKHLGTVTAEEVLQAKSAVLTAELERCERDLDRLGVHERIVAVAREVEKGAEQRYQAGRVPHRDLLAVRVQRLEAEVALERAKANAAPRPR